MKSSGVRWIAAVMSFIALIGCADPTYVQGSGDAPVTPVEKGADPCTYRFAGTQLCASFSWEQVATEKIPGIMILRLFRVSPLDGFFLISDTRGNLKASIFMPDMSHGAPPVGVEKLETGTYRLAPMYFSIMHGYWEIKIQLLEEGLPADEIRIPYNF